MRWTASGCTDIGRRRDRNEDAYAVDDDHGVYVVADGMGGHAGGAHASGLAVTQVVQTFATAVRAADVELPTGRGAVVAAALRTSVQSASARIRAFAKAHPEYKGMGTTVVALAVDGAEAHLAHVGDSRIYRLRRGDIAQMTDDHSLVAQSIRDGLLTAEQARTHRMRNVITRALGFDDTVDVEVRSLPAEAGDVYLLCSDGLSGKVQPAEIVEALTALSLDDAVRRLIALANARGGEDNITALAVRADAP
jgi:protein phosphatase